MSFVYIFITLVWISRIVHERSNLIGIHNFISVLIVLSLVECVMAAHEYAEFNKTGRRSLAHTIPIVILNALRSTLTNLIFLLTALGFGTLTNKLGRYAQSIGIMSFLFFVSSAINRAFSYLNQVKQIKTAVRIASFAPVAVFYGVFMFWAYSAIIRTLSYLASKGDGLKYTLMRCFGIWMVLHYFVIFILLITFLVINLFEEAEDVLLSVA